MIWGDDLFWELSVLRKAKFLDTLPRVWDVCRKPLSSSPMNPPWETGLDF